MLNKFKFVSLDIKSCKLQNLYIMQSNGGIIRAKTAIDNPVHTLLSGPVGGTIGGSALSKIIKVNRNNIK